MTTGNNTMSWIVNRRMRVMLLLGFSSGLPLALTGGTLQAWLTKADIDIKTIAIFSLVGLPYTLKFLWSPVMDRFIPPLLGRRRGWMVMMQLALIAAILSMSSIPPEQGVMILGVLALLVAFFSASQDIAIDAYRADLLQARERGFGSALSVAGYRIAMLVSGGVALMLAEQLGWQLTYMIMAGLLLIGVLSSLFGPEPIWKAEAPSTLEAAVVQPLKEFLLRPQSLTLLLLIVLYKLGDAFAGTLTTAFLLRGMEFSLTDVGFINKWLGFAATITGAMYGGLLLARYGLYRCLLWFGILQAITNLGFMVLALMGKSYLGLVTVILLENFSGGMGTAAFVAFLMALCDHRFTATQYALLSALSSVGRVLAGPPAGGLVDLLGWSQFFMVTFLVAIPGVVLLIVMRRTIQERYDLDFS